MKKIAKLFKDKSISDSTKDKLLFKTGSGLIETWSTHEQNKAERAKPAPEPKQAVKASETAPSHEQAAPAVLGEQQIAAQIDTAPAMTAAQIELLLQKLAAELPAYTPIPQTALQSIEAIPSIKREGFSLAVDAVISNLEQHLAEWKAVQARSRSNQ
ncbi:hypothetical protein D3C78_946990 [compost metagenome]